MPVAKSDRRQVAAAALRTLAQEWRKRARRLRARGFFAAAATWSAGARELEDAIGEGKSKKLKAKSGKSK